MFDCEEFPRKIECEKIEVGRSYLISLVEEPNVE